MQQNVYQQKFSIRSYEIDADQKVTIDAYVKIIQEASSQQSINLNFSFWDLSSENLSWVLLKKDFQFYKLPKHNDQITVETYPAKINTFFALRDYKVYDSGNNLITTASSKWSLINTVKRKIARIPERIINLDIPKTDLLAEPDFKLTKLTDFDFGEKYVIQSYDIDWNGHLNNGQLIKYILNAIKFPKINRFQIDFKSEVRIEEEIGIKFLQTESIVSCDVLNISNGKRVALAKFFLS